MNETDPLGSKEPVKTRPNGSANLEMSSQEILAAVRSVLAARRARSNRILPPQAFQPLDADEVEALEYHPWRRFVGCRLEVELRDLIESPREAFVGRCYRLLLLRDPSRKEASLATRLLDLGWDRYTLAAMVRWSKEGRRIGIPVRGLGKRLPSAVTRSLSRCVRIHPRKAP